MRLNDLCTVVTFPKKSTTTVLLLTLQGWFKKRIVWDESDLCFSIWLEVYMMEFVYSGHICSPQALGVHVRTPGRGSRSLCNFPCVLAKRQLPE